MREGNRVVCIETPRVYGGEHHPIKGEIYTIREVVDWRGRGMCLRLCEIVNRRLPYEFNDFSEAAWPMKGFRPVDYSVGEKIAEVLEDQFNQQPVLL